MRLVVFDLETTGLDPKHHQPIQVGAVALDGETLAELEAFEVKVRFERGRADEETLTVNSCDEGSWEANAISEHEAARRFGEFLSRHATTRRETKAGKPFFVAELVAFNSAFDVPFLQAWYERLSEFLPGAFHGRCVMQRALWAYYEAGLVAPPDWKLGTLCRAFGIQLGENAHDALHDARATAELLRHLIAGSNPRRVPAEKPPKRRQKVFFPKGRVRRPRMRARTWRERAR